eukprot:343461-Prymnesium_polylepis.1
MGCIPHSWHQSRSHCRRCMPPSVTLQCNCVGCDGRGLADAVAKTLPFGCSYKERRRMPPSNKFAVPEDRATPGTIDVRRPPATVFGAPKQPKVINVFAQWEMGAAGKYNRVHPAPPSDSAKQREVRGRHRAAICAPAVRRPPRRAGRRHVSRRCFLRPAISRTLSRAAGRAPPVASGVVRAVPRRHLAGGAAAQVARLPARDRLRPRRRQLEQARGPASERVAAAAKCGALWPPGAGGGWVRRRVRLCACSPATP